MKETKIYNCLVVDDEPIARQIMRSYISKTQNLEFIGECKNGVEALEIINSNQTIDIVFLDINMPILNGISVVKNLSRLPQIIFTTAYHEHAVESYELNAADYLLKPFSIERFSVSINKAIDEIIKNEILSHINTSAQSLLLIKSEGKTYPIKGDDIIYCVAMKNYTKIFLVNGIRLLPYIAISKFESDFKNLSTDLIRVHRSYIINKKYLKSFNTQQIIIEDINIPIGDQYKEDFLNSIHTEL
jgi:DNA-binding LytR/AlgR family response regulator